MRFELKSLTSVALAIGILGLSACGGGGGGGSSTAAADTTVTVSPSLGKFSAGAHVKIKTPGGTVLGSADTTSAGTASINVGTYSGPLVVEVTGDTTVTYYDEGQAQSKPFGASEVLRAIAPSVQTAVGVTPATHAAVEAIKSANSGNIPAAITSSTISTANNKIATALGISDVLLAPKLVDATTATNKTLDVGNAADKYALQLAALAKLASSGKTALDVAKDLAQDMSDGKLDGMVSGAPIPYASTTYTQASISNDISSKLQSAATDLGTTNTQTLVTNDPTIVGKVTTDVTNVSAPTPGVQLAKAMFAELRTTLASFSNSSKNGFLDLQAVRASDDMKLVVAPETDKVFNRLSTIGLALRTFEGAQTGAAFNGGRSGAVNINGIGTQSAWINQTGNLSDVVNGTGPYQYCFVALPATSSSTVTCLSANANSWNGSKIKFMNYVLTPTATSGQFTYTALRENRTPNLGTGGLGAASAPSVTIPQGTGTVTKTGTTSFTFAGTLPPSAVYADGTIINSVDVSGNPSTGVDTIALSATRTALTAANTYRYALTGSVATTSLDTSKSVSLAFTTGSYIDFDESAHQLLGMSMTGAVQTAGSKLTGTFAFSGITADKSGTTPLPTSIVFNGTISDVSTNGAGDILSGKLEVALTGYGNYDATKVLSSTNFIAGTATFTGTVQAPNRPLMKLIVGGNTTGFQTTAVSLNYSYGTVSITGTGTSTASGLTFSLLNQDGIQVAPNASNANQTLITKAGAAVGTLSSGVVNYVDGTSESVN